jgi:hypothetical protein
VSDSSHGPNDEVCGGCYSFDLCGRQRDRERNKETERERARERERPINDFVEEEERKTKSASARVIKRDRVLEEMLILFFGVFLSLNNMSIVSEK